MLLAPKLAEQIRAVASASPGVAKIWLFGSRAREDAGDRSDIDLAVECPGAAAADFARTMIDLSELDTLLPVDVVRLDEAGPELARRIRSEGVVMYER